MTTDEREKYAKSVVNRLRKERGLRALGKLKRGIPAHPRSCVLAVSLPCRSVNMVGEQVYFDGLKSLHDPELAEFARDFDAGYYPHLEQPKSEIKWKPPGSRKSVVLK